MLDQIVLFRAAPLLLAVALLLASGAQAAAPDTGRAGSLVNVTVVNPLSSGQSNVPFTLGLPFASGVIDAGHHIEAVDSGKPINCQEDNRASDLTGAVRFESLTCILPAMAPNQTRRPTLRVAAGAPATGTDISVADIIAAFNAASYDLPVTFSAINGAPGQWTASLLAALRVNHGWSNPTVPSILGTFRAGGGLASEYIVYAPAMNGPKPDPQMHVLFDMLCYKAERAAVSASNPILGCRIDEINENSFIQAQAPVDDYYGLSVGRGGAVASLPNSNPSANLAFKAASGNNIAVAASAPIFTPNSLGQTIANRVGIAVINGYTDPSHVQVNIYRPFASAALQAGGYTLYGTNHPYAARFAYRTLFSPWVTVPLAEAGQAHLGDPWNGGTGGPGTYIVKAKLVMNYDFPVMRAINDLTQIKRMGSNPMAYLNGGAQWGAGGSMGDMTLYLETSGERGDIGVIPDWDAQALMRYDANAAPRIFGNAARWASFPVDYRDRSTGLVVSPCNKGVLPACVGSVDWVIDGRFSGTPIAATKNSMTPWSSDSFAHDPEGFYVAYLLTGDFYWLESQQFSAFAAWAGNDPHASGTGVNKSVYSAPLSGIGYQERGRSWALRTITDAALLTPDKTNSALGMTKPVLKTLLQSEFGDPVHGAMALYVNQTGPQKFFSADGPHWTAINNNSFSSFEVGYAAFAYFHQAEQGMLDRNGQAMLTWLAETDTGMINSPAVNARTLAMSQYISVYNTSTSCPGRLAPSWTDAYAATALFYPGVSSYGPGPRNLPVGMNLSGSSGVVTANFVGGNYFATTNFYKGGWVVTKDGGAGQIVSVSAPNSLVIDTNAAQSYWTSRCERKTGARFPKLHYGASDVLVPLAAPADPMGEDWTDYINSSPSDYLQIVQANAMLASEHGLPGGAEAFAKSWNFTRGKMLGQYMKWNVAPREARSSP